MILHQLALFWRDRHAACLTQIHFTVKSEDTIDRVYKIISCIQQLSALQLYGAVLNGEIFHIDINKSVPAFGTEFRLEISLLPDKSINPNTGTGLIRLSIPGPGKEIEQAIKPIPPNYNHPAWQSLEQNIFPFIRLPNGIAIKPGNPPDRVKRAEIAELMEDKRPLPGRAPVDQAIVATSVALENFRSKLDQLLRADLQPNTDERDKAEKLVEKYQARLSYLLNLKKIEKELFDEVKALANTSPRPSDSNQDSSSKSQLAPAAATNKNKSVQTGMDSKSDASVSSSGKNLYLPVVPPQSSQDWKLWASLKPADFSNPALWTSIETLKYQLNIGSERSFRRTITSLRNCGLRTLPAKCDRRVQLLYRPDLPYILASWKATKAKTAKCHTDPSRSTTPPQRPQYNKQETMSTPSSSPSPGRARQSIDLTNLWSEISKLQTQQQSLQYELQILSLRLDFFQESNRVYNSINDFSLSLLDQPVTTLSQQQNALSHRIDSIINSGNSNNDSIKALNLVLQLINPAQIIDQLQDLNSLIEHLCRQRRYNQFRNKSATKRRSSKLNN